MAEEAVHPEQPEQRPARLLALAKPATILVVIVAVECIAVAVLLPSADDTQELGQELAAARAEGDEESPGDRTVPQEAPRAPQLNLLEVDLGSHHIATFQPASNTTLRVDLHLYGTVLADDLRDFELLYALHKHRVSEQVHATFRAAEITDLTDAGLGLIKRQILEKSNRTLGKPLLQDVVFSKFSFMEQ